VKDAEEGGSVADPTIKERGGPVFAPASKVTVKGVSFPLYGGSETLYCVINDPLLKAAGIHQQLAGDEFTARGELEPPEAGIETVAGDSENVQLLEFCPTLKLELGLPVEPPPILKPGLTLIVATRGESVVIGAMV
jgi:hypothetical protein